MSRNVRKVQLPKNFAEKLLECEIQYKLNDSPSKQNIKELIELYTLGVEYYQSIRSHKYVYFQIKMNEVFTASTLNALNEQKASDSQSPLRKKMRSTLQEQKIQALQIKQKQQKMLQEVASNTSQLATTTTIKKIINQNDQKNKQVNQKVNQQLESQDQKLKQKLQKRKSRLLFSKSFTSASMGQNDTQDTLFSEVQTSEGNFGLQMKPIEVSFGSVIKEDESDEDQPKKQVLDSIKVKEIKSQARNRI